PHLAPRLCHPPAQPRRRPAGGAVAAGPQRPVHHPDLHPRRPGPDEGPAGPPSSPGIGQNARPDPPQTPLGVSQPAKKGTSVRIPTVLAALLFMLAGPLLAADAAPDKATGERILERLQAARPDFEYGAIKETAMPGIYQVQI